MQQFKLSFEQKKIFTTKIKEFFLEEREEEIGEIAASDMLEFFLENMGTIIYNEAIKDSYKYISGKLEDLFELEKQIPNR